MGAVGARGKPLGRGSGSGFRGAQNHAFYGVLGSGERIEALLHCMFVFWAQGPSTTTFTLHQEKGCEQIEYRLRAVGRHPSAYAYTFKHVLRHVSKQNPTTLHLTKKVYFKIRSLFSAAAGRRPAFASAFCNGTIVEKRHTSNM